MRRCRILVVTPYFPPANGADAHRVRCVIPFLRDHGWDAEILAVRPECLAVPQDPWLMVGVPADIPVYRCGAVSLRWSRIPGLGTLDLRALRSLKRGGATRLRNATFDLVYFSTTAFGLLPIAIPWKREFNVPFVVDYQDPWVSDYYRENPQVVPPGGRLKYFVVDRLSRAAEPKVLRECSGITSVSPRYPEQLDRRYPWFKATPRLVAPFPGAQRDFDLLKVSAVPKQTLFRRDDGLKHWVYVGRGGGDMHTAIRGLFRAIADWKTRSPDEAARIRIHFVGTSYAPPGTGTATISPIAQLFGLGDIVSEITDRIPYVQMLQCLTDADALLAIGSNDPAYTASKLYPYLLAQKPLLAIFHEASPANDVIEAVGGATTAHFGGPTSEQELANCIRDRWLNSGKHTCRVPLDTSAFAPFTDVGQARQLCEFFDMVVERAASVSVGLRR